MIAVGERFESYVSFKQDLNDYENVNDVKFFKEHSQPIRGSDKVKFSKCLEKKLVYLEIYFRCTG